MCIKLHKQEAQLNTQPMHEIHVNNLHYEVWT